MGCSEGEVLLIWCTALLSTETAPMAPALEEGEGPTNTPTAKAVVVWEQLRKRNMAASRLRPALTANGVGAAAEAAVGDEDAEDPITAETRAEMASVVPTESNKARDQLDSTDTDSTAGYVIPMFKYRETWEGVCCTWAEGVVWHF